MLFSFYNDDNNIIEIDSIKIENLEYFNMVRFLFIACGIHVHPTNTLKMVSNKNKISIKKEVGNGFTHYVTVYGIMEILEKSQSIEHIIKKRVVNKFIKLGLIKETLIFQSSKEKLFGDDLYLFFKNFDFLVTPQICVDQYVVDFKIEFNNIVVFIEYDEKKHIGYDKKKEKNRENEIKKYCNELIRIDDSKSNIENISIIFKKIITTFKGNT